MEKNIWRCHSKLVQHKNTIWCIFTQIWSACTDIIFCHFRLISARLPHYETWSSKDRKFFVILGNFLPFYLPNTLKNEDIKNEKKNPGDIIILHECTKNHDHLLYCSRDMTHDGCNCYFHFGLSGIFPSTFI